MASFSRRAFSTKSPYTEASALSILEKHFSPAVPRAPKNNNMVAASAKGSWITDIYGKKYLDLQTGIGVASTGHCHPKCVIYLPAACGAIVERPRKRSTQRLRRATAAVLPQP